MNSRSLSTCLLVLFFSWACSSSQRSGTSGTSTDSEIDESDVVALDDVEAGDGLGAGQGPPDTKPEIEQPDVPTLPAAAPFDFEATGPWFSCGTELLPEEVVYVEGFSKANQFFGAENKRQIEIDVEFPEYTQWAQVGFYFKLECPKNGKCDHWDRSGSVQLVLNPDAAKEEWEIVEIARHITPYRTEMCQYIDITPLAPLLTGKKRLLSFIDTWVGPGHHQGEGWRVTTGFAFYPGPSAAPSSVLNVWKRRSITVGEVELDKNVDSQIEPFTFNIPDTAKKVVAHLITTGHSFGNTHNCAEFCQMRHDVIVNGTAHSSNPWRPDCDQNPVSNQAGTWLHPRNGWCPGAIAVGKQMDITDAVVPGINNLDFDIRMANGAEYDNVSPVNLLPYALVSLKLYIYE